MEFAFGLTVVSIALVACVYRLAWAWETVAEFQYGKETASAPTPRNELIPDDLMALAMQENEVWAQEEMIRVLHERYETYHDWNKVRVAMGVARRD